MSQEHAGALLRWASSRFSDPRDAEEVVADTLVRAWRAADQFDPERGDARAWLFGIAKNAAADHYRKGRRHLAAVPTEIDPDDPTEDGSIARLVEASEVADALDLLSADHRAAVVAAYFEGRSTREIAASEQVPDGTVKSRLHYGLKALRSHLEESGILR